MSNHVFILKGVAGSQAHGLATPQSDVDLHGVISYPTNYFWRLWKPEESLVGTDPDYSYHELEKFLRLAMKANPTQLETIWLHDYLEKEPVWGDRLLRIRTAFSSRAAVKGAYLGYAADQFVKLNNVIQSTTYSDDEKRKRARKFGKHIIRLMEQGYGLYTTGKLEVRVADPAMYFDLLDNWAMQDIVLYASDRKREFENAESALPERPDTGAIEEYLYEYRKAHVDRGL
jgi:hypothetical protein